MTEGSETRHPLVGSVPTHVISSIYILNCVEILVFVQAAMVWGGCITAGPQEKNNFYLCARSPPFYFTFLPGRL